MLIRPVFPGRFRTGGHVFPVFPQPDPREPGVRGEGLDGRFPPLTGLALGAAPAAGAARTRQNADPACYLSLGRRIGPPMRGI